MRDGGAAVTHDCEQHPVPTLTCYQKCRCRCEKCRQARAKYVKKWKLMNSRGVEPYVDATPAREHAKRLMKLGMSHRTIAVKAGMTNSGLDRLLGVRKDVPQSKRIRRATEKSILAVKYTNVIGTTFIDATGSKRRLQDLALRGFGAEELGDLCGIEYHSLRVIRSGVRKTVRVETAKAITVMHQLLEGTMPVTTRIANQNGLKTTAKRRGFAPIAAWDNIDDPAEEAKGAMSYGRSA